MDVKVIVISAVAIGLALWFVGRPKFEEIRAQITDPTQQAIKKFGVFERLRLGRLARSERVIDDAEQSRRAELVGRATFVSAEKAFGRREALALPVVLLFLVLLRSEGQGVIFWLEIAVLISMAVAYLWWMWARRKLLKTAALNGWTLSRGQSAMPANVRSTTIKERSKS